jgi:hypothetical protein
MILLRFEGEIQVMQTIETNKLEVDIQTFHQRVHKSQHKHLMTEMVKIVKFNQGINFFPGLCISLVVFSFCSNDHSFIFDSS